MKKLTKQQFIEKAINKHGDKYDYSKTVYVNSRATIEIKCPIHGYFSQVANEHLQGHGCQECAVDSKKISLEVFIKRSNEKHNNRYDYSLVKYNNSYSKVEIICPIHGSFFQDAGSHIKGRGCSICKESLGEKEVFKVLTKMNISFNSQKKFKWCRIKKVLPFDFYLPERNTCIEFDGRQHFEEIPFWGGKKRLEEIKIRDEIKTRFCNENEIHLIRIPYFNLKNIKEIIENNLGETLCCL